MVARPALDGGTPVRSSFLPFARPSFGPEEEQAVVEVLRSGWVGSGPRVARFEAAFAEYLGTPHALAVASCTAGLHLTLRAFGIGPGDEVITSPVTFPSTANAILYCGARPVLADVLPGLLTLDPAAVRAGITPRTRAILAVHLAGWPCEMDGLAEVAAAAGVPIIEDAAHGLGGFYRGRAIGTLGAAAVFSFYATKNMTTADGGMITTARADLVEGLSGSRLHGIDVDASRRANENYVQWEAVSLGWKYNLTDLAAAIGLVQLAKLPGFVARRRAIDGRYRARLAALAAVEALVGPPQAETGAHLFPILLRPGALRIDRDTVLNALIAEHVGVGVHFRALPLHRFFRDTVGMRSESVPVAIDASQRTLSLPLFPDMSDGDVDDVVEALSRITRYYAA